MLNYCPYHTSRYDINSTEDAFKFMICEHGRMLAEVDNRHEASWPEVGSSLYGKPRNFDQFKFLIQMGFIKQTDATKDAKTLSGKPKFKYDSLSSKAKYKCTAKGIDTIALSKSYPNAIAFCRQVKDFNKSTSSVDEYVLTSALKGEDCILDEDFINSRLLPEIANAPDAIRKLVTSRLSKLSCHRN